MMRILSIQSDLPEPTFGGRKRVYHLTQALAEAGHEIQLLVVMNPKELPRLRMLNEMGIRTHPVLFDAPRELLPATSKVQQFLRRTNAAYRFRLSTSRAISAPLPRVARSHWMAPLRRALRELLRHESFDLVIIENEENLLLTRELPYGVPVIIDVQNVLSSMKEREVALQNKFDIFDLHHLSERAQPAKLRRFERSMLQRCDAIIAMSEREAQTLCDLAPEYAQRVHVVPNGVDVASYRSTKPPPNKNKLVYTGLMSYAPNDDAMRWFSREIWPLIIAECPEVRLDIVGAEPAPDILDLKKDNRIRVTGRVDLVQPYLEDADVVIVPLRMGGGTRLKILEAAAMRRPIVSTTVGAEGLHELRDGEHLLLRDNPREFANAVLRLLQNNDAIYKLADNAHTIIEKHYDWSNTGQRFIKIVDNITDN